MSEFIPAPTIGEILQEEFLEPMNLSAYKLAQEIHVPVSKIPSYVRQIMAQLKAAGLISSLRGQAPPGLENRPKRLPFWTYIKQ